MNNLSDFDQLAIDYAVQQGWIPPLDTLTPEQHRAFGAEYNAIQATSFERFGLTGRKPAQVALDVRWAWQAVLALGVAPAPPRVNETPVTATQRKPRRGAKNTPIEKQREIADYYLANQATMSLEDVGAYFGYSGKTVQRYVDKFKMS